jgi:hypothetical protein
MPRGNNKPRKGPPKGVVPENFKDTVAKPGDVKNPLGINRKPGPFDKLCAMLEESRTVTLDDGRVITLDREEQGLLVLVRKMQRGPSHELNDPNWRFAVDEILSRRMPKPRDAVVNVGQVNVSHTVLGVSFVDQLREGTGRDSISSQDVLDALDAETFKSADSPSSG